MTYPLSAEVTSGQPTAAAHYNNLRKDALKLGNADADSLNLAEYFARHAENFSLQKLSTNRVRVPYTASGPATIVISGCLLKAPTAIDLPAGLITGYANTWYIFAVRTAGSTAFTLTANTSAVEAPDQRLVGEVFFDGTNITYVKCYLIPLSKFPEADYDSGWFAVSNGGNYIRSHNLGSVPSLVVLLWCATGGVSLQVPVTVVVATTPSTGEYNPIYIDDTNVTILTGNSASYDATCHSRVASSASGYYKVRAYK